MPVTLCPLFLHADPPPPPPPTTPFILYLLNFGQQDISTAMSKLMFCGHWSALFFLISFPAALALIPGALQHRVTA